MTLPRLIAICGLVALGMTSVEAADDSGGPASPDAKAATFEGQVLPVLSRYCTDCHGKAKPKAGLDLIGIHRREFGRAEPEDLGSDPGSCRGADHAAGGSPATERGRIRCADGMDPGGAPEGPVRRTRRPGPGHHPPAQPRRVQQHDPRPGRRRLPPGRRLPLRRRRLRVRQHRRRPVAAAAPDGEIPGRRREDRRAGDRRPNSPGRRRSRPGRPRTWAERRGQSPQGRRAGPGQHGRDRGHGHLARRRRRISSGSRRSASRPARSRRGWRSGSTARRSGRSTSRPSKERPGPTRSASRRRRAPGKLAVAFLNDYYQADAPDPEAATGTSSSTRSRCRGRSSTDEGHLPESHRRIVFRRAHAGDGRTRRARAILERFAGRAYRRPATAEEVDRLVGFVDLAEKNGDTFELGIQLARPGGPGLAALPLPRRARPRRRRRGRRAPDRRLRAGHPAVVLPLEQHAGRRAVRAGRRGEAAPAARSSRRRSGGCSRTRRRRPWSRTSPASGCRLRNLEDVSPDPKPFPELRRAAARGDARGDGAVLRGRSSREDRSILDFLDADFTFLNERLAQHYGIAGVEGDEFRRVALTDDQRGGLLTQASILTLTSNPTRTSPVKRGKWVLEQILGHAPAAPAARRPGAERRRKDALTGTLRQRMEQHRANPTAPRATPGWTRSASASRTSTRSAPGATKDGKFADRPVGHAARRARRSRGRAS